MKCAACGKTVGVNAGQFKENGRVPGLIMTRYEFKCRDCLKKKPIDDTSRAKVSHGEAPF